jgi:kynurenine formamidase
MGRTPDGGEYSLAWTPPDYTVDDNGKRVGYVNTSEPNNWGRWGPDDQRGTANFITPDKVTAAAGLIRTGQTISCAVPLAAGGPVHPSRPGVVHLFGYTGADFTVGSQMQLIAPRVQGADDYIFMPLQGSTQWDGLAHITADDVMYNGFWIGNTESAGGAGRNSIHQLKDGLTGRGVLLDLVRHRGVDRLEPGVAITPDDLDACAAAQGTTIGTGDILLLRTGHVPWFYSLADKSEFWTAGAPGLGRDCVSWIHEKEIAAIALDNIATEVEPAEEPNDRYFPLHIRLIRDLGLTLGEVWWLEDLAQACAAQERWEFFLAAPPLNLANAVGSPLNPTAVL